jgi:hypothetical protein
LNKAEFDFSKDSHRDEIIDLLLSNETANSSTLISMKEKMKLYSNEKLKSMMEKLALFKNLDGHPHSISLIAGMTRDKSLVEID